MTFKDLVIPTKDTLHKIFAELLDKVVARDGNVTRGEEQLDQLCNIILLKLDSDKQGKINDSSEVYFRVLATKDGTAQHIKSRFSSFTEVFPDIFITNSDKEIRFESSTIYDIVEKMSMFNFIDIGGEAVSIAFQVLRSAALKQEEGQYFTPKQVIQAAIELIDLSLDDIIIDPACGTGGFLIQTFVGLKDKHPEKEREISSWAQTHLFGIDKDAIGVKLTKAIMQILGDGSTHCVRGDSVLTHTWETKYQHLRSNHFSNGRFTKVLTNPPFGAPLKISYSEAKKSGLSITEHIEAGKDIELGLAMLNRCCDLLSDGGKLCIVLPETYFFSSSYKYVRDWIKKYMKPICIANVPMDAFQGFCRAKTNLYVFEKIKEDKSNLNIEKDIVVILNPKTCGIYKNGSDRFIVNKKGQRTKEIDNELLRLATAYAKTKYPKNSSGSCNNIVLTDKIEENSSEEEFGIYEIPLSEMYEKDVFVPQYFDRSLQKPIEKLMEEQDFNCVSIGELCDGGVIHVSAGHGSPSNDVRNGNIPYIKVSDIRNMRININPTNLVSPELAKKFWKTENGKSNLKSWDLISPSRASSNIGEFAILLPGEEQVVLTKEVFVIRVINSDFGYSPFYLLWALSLDQTRKQWERIALMQTNREDVGERYREILIPKPKSLEWAEIVSKPFRDYFEGIANAKKHFAETISKDAFDYIASVKTFDHEINLDNDDCHKS